MDHYYALILPNEETFDTYRRLAFMSHFVFVMRRDGTHAQVRKDRYRLLAEGEAYTLSEVAAKLSSLSKPVSYVSLAGTQAYHQLGINGPDEEHLRRVEEEMRKVDRLREDISQRLDHTSVDDVSDATIREKFEAEYVTNPHNRHRNEVGDYVHPSIQDAWAGFLAGYRLAVKEQPCPQP